MTPPTPRQRLRSTLERDAVDRPPFICPGGMMNMAVTEVMQIVGESWPRAHVEPESMARLVLGMAEHGGVENLGAPFCMTIEAEGMGAAVDLGDAKTEPRVIEYVISELSHVDRLPRFSASEGRAVVAAEATRMLVAERPELPMIASITGPISLATSLIEPLTFYRAMRRDKPAAHALLDLSTDAAIALGDALVDAGADTVCIADPSGTGELIGAKAFDEFALPYINRIVEHFAARDVLSIVHICGDVGALTGVLDRVGAPCISIDSNVSFRTLRSLAPGHLTMGNVSTYLLEYGKAETLHQVAASRVEDGVNVIAPACGIGPRTPLKNIKAVADAVAEAGNEELVVEFRTTA
ncbi:MAG TPA: uroporphyrinogen decarboxylase family protein [Coriobacteriia bacterium]|nr:uroporphyrinogen decarboxylase family protein [Coriobacteriia bacterium]